MKKTEKKVENGGRGGKRKKKMEKKGKEGLPAFFHSLGSLPAPTFDGDISRIPAFINLIHQIAFAVTGLASFGRFVCVGFSTFSGSQGFGTAVWAS